ncbi:hypothetical protein [Prevotella fusca]|uniref:Lipoprotein n=1 Tax=Prevotella fusca JCM 17724 TaxID=1236517 RepID=A0A0K1NI16_9BACT|nr:hypothetical protein [Prevotella fusca]AKU68734.1 hypothetical protein ADJ77_02555 [Prevotella fusca JCM 17724]QUB86363.1 hypothetical protein J5A51_09700 [Prevotella fusca JCM 17724]
MNRLLLAFIAAMLLFSSCGTNKTVSESLNPVRFSEARNYFHIGNETKAVIKKIPSQAVLEKEFGEAAFMGKGGEPTRIDFSRNFAIAYILPETNRKTVLAPLSLTAKGNRQLLLKFKLEQGKVQTFSTQPFFIIIVDKKYAGYKVIESL